MSYTARRGRLMSGQFLYRLRPQRCRDLRSPTHVQH